MIHALPASATGEMPAAPDVDSRAPSLANWVGDTLDPGVRELLTAGDRSVVAQPVLLSLVGSDPVRTWERAWYRRTSGAHAAERVAVAVAEDNEDEVILRINGRDCGRFTPPWISRRALGPEDAARIDFTNRMLAVIDSVVQASRQSSASGATYTEDEGKPPRPQLPERASNESPSPRR